MYSKSDIKKQLKNIGIKNTDTVLIHTAFSKVGEVEGGPEGFIDAFCEYLSEGLFIIPTHTWNNVNAENPTYIVNKTIPCIGLIPTIAAKRNDGIRSLHPTHSIWAHGKNAHEFVSGEEFATTPAPIGGAWWKLGGCNAKILLIGVTHNRNTYIHAVDEIAGLDDRLAPHPWNVTVIDKNGNKLTHSFRNHHNTGSENFDNFEKAFIYYGAQTDGFIGDAKVKVIEASKCRDILLKIYAKTTENLCLTRCDLPEYLWKN